METSTREISHMTLSFQTQFKIVFLPLFTTVYQISPVIYYFVYLYVYILVQSANHHPS